VLSEQLTLLRALEILTLITGGTIALLALRAARRNKSNALLITALGFGVIALGSFAGGVYFEFFSAQDLQALLTTRIMQVGSQLLGFLMILYSLYSRIR
jgi:zinc transporter ZupT